MMNAKEILEAVEPDATEYETESSRIKAAMDALCDGEALASIGCTDDDQVEVEEAYSILNERFDRAAAIEKVGGENLLQPSEVAYLFKIAGELNAPTPESLYIKATMFVLLGAESDWVSTQEMIDGTAWAVDTTIAGKHCHAETSYTDHRLSAHPTDEEVAKLVDDLNLEAARNTTIEEAA